MAAEHLVDVRDLEPPGPFEQVLTVLRRLPPGDHVLMLHRREPLPLYAALAPMGFAHRTMRDGPDAFRIYIWRRDDAPPALPERP